MKILHTADIHLGYHTYGRVDPQTGRNTRLLDFERCFKFMVQRGLDEGIDLFLFCGDAYRTAEPKPTEQQIFAECLRPIAEAGIPMVMIVGNHDHPVAFGKASAIDIFRYVEGDVHVFRRPESAVVETRSGPLQLIAMPWPIRSVLLSKDEHRKKSPTEVRAYIEERYASFIQQAAAELDPALPTVLAGHFSVQGAELAGSERTSLIADEPKLSLGQLTVPPIDYVALGHIHRQQDRNAGAHPPVVYCGSIERINFKEADEPKGFALVEIEAAHGRKTTRFAFVSTPARDFVDVRVDARQAPDPTQAVLDALPERRLGGAIVRVRYQVDEAQAPRVDVRRIREALAEAEVVASIERTVVGTERQRRSVVTRDASLRDAMAQYLAQHEHLTPLHDQLVAAALALEADYETRQSNP